MDYYKLGNKTQWLGERFSKGTINLKTDSGQCDEPLHQWQKKTLFKLFSEIRVSSKQSYKFSSMQKLW